MRIAGSSTISFQPTFRRRGFSAELSALTKSTTLISPDYAAFIPAMDRRRMSDVLKMSITCSLDCLEQAGVSQPDAIIVGTCMGPCTHTKNFLDKISSARGGLISPTSFMLSTHCTIAGQISLLLKNHNYNTTYTHNSLSFEHALIDAMISQEDCLGHILVGGADELEETLFNTKAKLGLDRVETAYGASFFVLSPSHQEAPYVDLVDVGSYGQISDIGKFITSFLESNGKDPNQIDVVLYSASRPKVLDELSLQFGNQKLFDFQKLCGTWFTNSAFALGYGVDLFSNQENSHSPKPVRTILICNNLIPENLGLILLAQEQ